MKNLLPSQAAQELLSRRRAKTSLAAYIDYLDIGLVPARHHRLLLDELEAVERGDTPRLMVCMPPGAAKSTYTTGIFPAWYLGRNPTKSVIAASHTQELIERFGRRARNYFASPVHQNVFGVGVAGDSMAAGRWDTEKGGEYYAAGVGGTIVGRRADLGIIDDSVKSREDADSERSRERAWEWYVNDFMTRLKPGAAQIIVNTRWHEDDLAGRILDREGHHWRLIEVPMEAMPGDLLGRTPGERLWPEWFTEEMVAHAKLDTRAWNALYQQQPASEEGDYFKAAWFGEYDSIPDLLHVYGASDYAVTEGGGDYTEHGVFGIDPLSFVYVLDWWRDQTAADMWIDRQCDLIVAHEPQCWFGEAGPIRRAVEPFLTKRMNERRAYCRMEWLPSIHDKPTRSRPFQALASMGKVLFPKQAPWKADLLGQLMRFPAGKYDDGVDVCSLLGRGIEHVRLPRARRASTEPRRFVQAGGEASGWMGI
jgi:predicted phage terminase large subunit-like protein